MRLALLLLIAALVCASIHGGQPQLKPLRVSWDPYVVPHGVSNAVVVLYKATFLAPGVFTPPKPTAYFPASRTNGVISVLPGIYHFYATVQAQPLPESLPSNIVTNLVN
jgi:hypothetical protein